MCFEAGEESSDGKLFATRLSLRIPQKKSALHGGALPAWNGSNGRVNEEETGARREQDKAMRESTIRIPVPQAASDLNSKYLAAALAPRTVRLYGF